MTLWLDAQLPPRLARWITAHFEGLTAVALRDIGLRDADDTTIFKSARAASAVVVTKDSDFIDLHERHGSPPKILWLTCGNTSEAELQRIFTLHLQAAVHLLSSGEDLVEIMAL